MGRVKVKSSTPKGTARDFVFLTQEMFVRRLHLEQKRTERSRRAFVLMLLESRKLFKANDPRSSFKQVLTVISAATRETDVKGWYEEGSTIGIIFTELGESGVQSTRDILIEKIRSEFLTTLGRDLTGKIKFSCFMFPDEWDKEMEDSSSATLYPPQERRLSLRIKRVIDIIGSLAGIIMLSPLMILIALAIKLTSKGPILFRQARVGQFGHKFTFLKFRSMNANNDHAIHRDYVKSLIAGSGEPQQVGKNGATTYKLTNDPRITRVGKLLRKTSLDELPQFLNVLAGQMSLVGPRPPIPYEVESYDLWHRRRLLLVKPGITGLWQVNGRCRTTFDEMVRLDLQYARSWSVWLDLKILLQTPGAVVAGDGAH
jgi:lipopolysaccharide/colanic/teichoic acid biosynthesis glycosyltransferase